jgi:hypothetical protein
MAKASVKVADFSGVKERGDFNPKHVEEGDYAAKVVKVEDGEVKSGDNKGDFQYIFTIKLQKFSQYSYPYYCKLQENQLWKLRNLAVAAGLNVPKKRQKFDPNKIAGKSIGVTMEDDEYTNDKGKTTLKSVIAAVFPVSELADGGQDLPDDDEFDEDSAPVAAVDDEDGSEDEAEQPKKSKKAKAGGKKGKKGKKGKGSKDDLEELSIDDV